MLQNELRLLLAGSSVNSPDKYGSLENIYKSRKIKDRNIDRDLEYIEKHDIKVVDYFCEGYPKMLRSMEYPPLVLFMKGSFRETELPFAVVGTRYPSGYGQRVIKYIVPYLVKAGFAVVSGMARGVDALSHKEAIKNSGYTVAVLGSGIDVVYPLENKALYKEIVEKGCVMSEFPLGMGPVRHNFPRRNRIIAGLSKGTLVVEADIKSGSLITARLTEEQSKPVFSVPGEIFSKRSRGTNKLISQGAVAVNDIGAILSYFYIELKHEIEDAHENIKLSASESDILNILEGDMSMDELLLKTGIDISQLNDILFDLEMKGLIKHTPSDGYEKL